jgi:hypothetical protein
VAASAISARLTDENDRPAKSADSERDKVSEPYAPTGSPSSTRPARIVHRHDLLG